MTQLAVGTEKSVLAAVPSTEDLRAFQHQHFFFIDYFYIFYR